MVGTTNSFDAWLLEKLRDDAEALEYLKQHFTDNGEDDFAQRQLTGLQNVARARGYALVPRKGSKESSADPKRASIVTKCAECGGPIPVAAQAWCSRCWAVQDSRPR